MTALHWAPVNPASLVPSLLFSGLESPLGFGTHDSLCRDLSPGLLLILEAQFKYCFTGLTLHPVPFSAVAGDLGLILDQGRPYMTQSN